MTSTSDIISRLKEVRKEKDLSFGDIMELMQKNGDYLSKSTISRVFKDDSEGLSFRYEETIRPIAKALLDMETIEEDDSADIQAMKALLQYKLTVIEQLEEENKRLKVEKEAADKNISYLKEQISRKDQRIDVLLEAILQKDLRYDELWNLALTSLGKSESEASKK